MQRHKLLSGIIASAVLLYGSLQIGSFLRSETNPAPMAQTEDNTPYKQRVEIIPPYRPTLSVLPSDYDARTNESSYWQRRDIDLLTLSTIIMGIYNDTTTGPRFTSEPMDMLNAISFRPPKEYTLAVDGYYWRILETLIVQYHQQFGDTLETPEPITINQIVDEC